MRHLLIILPLTVAYLTIVFLVNRYGNRDLLAVFVSISITLPIGYLVVDRFVQKNRLLRMKEEALRAELAMLKNQINPHFFFNTLNNLYGLVVSGSKHAPDLVLKLADLMRFTIYEGRKERVALHQEITYLENYLAIQSVRTQAKEVDVRFEKDLVDPDLAVPPLMFIILLENAFKHGVSTLNDGAYVHIRLRADLKRVYFEVENNCQPGRDTLPGIGLANLKRRLALLFPGRHELQLNRRDHVFHASLKLR